MPSLVMTHTKVSVLEEDEGANRHIEGCSGDEKSFTMHEAFGDVRVVERVVGYKKIRFHTHENVGYGDVHLPEIQMHTTGYWLRMPASYLSSLGVPRASAMDGLRGLAQASKLSAAIALMIDQRDLGGTVTEGDTDDFAPTIHLFDRIPGGIGLASRIFEQRNVFWSMVQRQVERCPCSLGCPACVGPRLPTQETQQSSTKYLALRVLQDIARAE